MDSLQVSYLRHTEESNFSSSVDLFSVQHKRCHKFSMYINCWEHADFAECAV